MKNLKKVVKQPAMGNLCWFITVVSLRPYDGKWSKSMVGYGPEDDHFVLELTYNYGIGSYKLGNDFKGITIVSQDVYKRVHDSGWPTDTVNEQTFIQAPDGYTFHVDDSTSDGNPLKKLTLASSDFQPTIKFWSGLCGMKILSQQDDRLTFSYDPKEILLEFVKLSGPVDHGTAYGRIALAFPATELAGVQQTATESGYKILTPLVSLDTPGKATVQVVILADPDGHEVCFVGDEAFRQLSQVDPQADQLLADALSADKSDEWFAKRGRTKASASQT